MQQPLAYFLTWTTYGSWLPGDDRGWVQKPGSFEAPDARREESSRRKMTETAVALDPEQMLLVEGTITAHCVLRRWRLYAVNCRTEHVHVVVGAPNDRPNVVMNQFKAWCTIRLKEYAPSKPEARAKAPGSSAQREKWWTQGGSKRWLYDEKSLRAAIVYVSERQSFDGRQSR